MRAPADWRQVGAGLGHLLGRTPTWVVVLAIAGGLLAWQLGAVERRPVNADALDTFTSIIDHCKAETFPDQTDRCADVLSIVEYCKSRGARHCTAEGFYRAMERLGYLLPPLRLETAPP